jgi:hypothetical protein
MQITLLQQRVARNAYDNEAWELLIDELWAVRAQPGVADTLKSALQTIVKQYPTAVRRPVHSCALSTQVQLSKAASVARKCMSLAAHPLAL